MSERISVIAEHIYDVVFQSVSAKNIQPVLAGASKIAIIVPSDLVHLATPLVDELNKLSDIEKVILIDVPEGESQKNISTVERCWSVLGSENFRRNDLVIGLGGGATTDLAGFIAATWLRGIHWIAIPTSLAGMVDAAIGGKTGINTDAGKNLVGSFHSPQLVLIDIDFLKSLPLDELRAGMAEVIKCGFIADQRILEIIEGVDDFYEWNSSSLRELIYRAVAVKAEVVSKDLKESFLREVLNYGHTLAHAIERHEKYQWRHGDAVAVGMAFIANLTYEMGFSSDELLERHRTILTKAGLPQGYPSEAWPELLTHMQSDKKARSGGLRFVAVNASYEVIRLEKVPTNLLQRAYERIAT